MEAMTENDFTFVKQNLLVSVNTSRTLLYSHGSQDFYLTINILSVHPTLQELGKKIVMVRYL